MARKEINRKEMNCLGIGHNLSASDKSLWRERYDPRVSRPPSAMRRDLELPFSRSLKMKKLLVVLLLSLPLFAQTNPAIDPPPAAVAGITAERMRAHMSFLADDLLEGRGTGTRGHEIAARYVQTQFELLGLKPAGVNGYRQEVPFRSITLVPEQSSVVVKR